MFTQFYFNLTAGR